MRLPNAPAWLIERPIAHRGLHDVERGTVENTIAAAEAAIAAGFAIECDVQMSRDGEAFVFHDETLDRLTDASGALIEKSAAEIKAAPIRNPSPASAGEAGLKGRMGCGPPLRRSSDGANVTASPQPERPAFHTPSVAFGDTPGSLPGGKLFPASRRRGRSASIPTFAEFLKSVAGRAPVICELKSRFDRDWRVADRVAGLAAAYEGPLAFKSFDPDLIAYLRLRYPALGRPTAPCPIGIVAEASYDRPGWNMLSAKQKQDWTDFDHFDRLRPDFLSWNVDDLPHKIPFLAKEFLFAPVMAWTVRSARQREAARKWADQIVFEGEGRP